MGHTVMWVCTVYFTAIVGCAFSSPRFNSGEGQQSDSGTSDTEKDSETLVAEISTQEKYDQPENKKENIDIQESPKIEDTGGGTVINIKSSSATIADLKKSINGSVDSQSVDEQIHKFIQERHLESVKEQLLTKLQLPFPPKLRGPMPLLPLDEIEKVYLESNNDASFRPNSHYFAKTVRKFIPGKDVTERCLKKSTGCYYFDLRGRVDPSEVQKVQLWIYKLFNHNNQYLETFIVSELGKINRRRNVLRTRNLVERYETTQKYGWIKIDVTKTTMKWLLKPRLNNGMAVICKDCQQKNYKRIFSTKNETQPFLVVTTRKAHDRSKRSTNNLCTDKSTECCLMPFTINFREIGWDAITYPPSISVNYCRGSCHGRLAMTTNHTSIIQTYRWLAADDTEMEQLTPCCAPVSYSSQSILYFDGDKVQETRIPNVSVTRCGCI